MDGTRISALQSAVGQAIQQGRLGAPKFLRCILSVGGSEGLEAVLSDLVSLGEVWFGARPIQRYRLGEDRGVYVTEMLRWPEGQGALLTVSTAAPLGAPYLDLMLVGSRGTLYHEGSHHLDHPHWGCSS